MPRILLNVALNPFSGYGNDGIGLTRALLKRGYDIYLSPVSVRPPIPADLVQLFTKQLDPPFDLLIEHVSPLELRVPNAALATCRQRVAWTMWEYTSLKHQRGWSNVAREMGRFTDLVSYDRVTASAFNEISPKKLTHHIIQGGYEPERWPYLDDRDWKPKGAGPFRFFMEGMLHSRKDPFLAVQAFSELKAEGDFDDAELHLKDNMGAVPPELTNVIPGLKVHQGFWEEQRLLDFYKGCHVLLAPSRGEGKNMPALQFLSTGGTCIVTNWGGHEMWLRPDIGFGLQYELHDSDPKQPGVSKNARVKTEDLKAAMRYAYENRGECRLKGELASRYIPATMSWDSVVSRLEDRVIYPKR